MYISREIELNYKLFFIETGLTGLVGMAAAAVQGSMPGSGSVFGIFC